MKVKMNENILARNLITCSAVMTIIAGIIHLVLVPGHVEHAPAHGLFFLLIGLAQIVWGILVWRQPTLKLYYIGSVMAGWLIVLYGVTRWLPAPFSHGPEGIETIDIVCKLCEGVGLISLLIIIFHGMVLHANQFSAWRTVSLIVLVSFLAAFVTYGVARAAEPIFPKLAGPVDEHHHDESVPSEEEHRHDGRFLPLSSIGLYPAHSWLH
jgi:hypothetical protein